jgi:hypothetical protein
MPDKGWHRAFDDPIPLPGGGVLRTLRDAGNFIAKLSKREHDAPAWLAAIQALVLVASNGGETMLPRIGIMRALYPGEVIWKTVLKLGCIRFRLCCLETSALIREQHNAASIHPPGLR